MNKHRRKKLETIIEHMNAFYDIKEEISREIQDVKDEEEEAFDNLPESIQGSERGEQMQEYIEAMEQVIEMLDEIDTDDMQSILMEVIEG